MAILDPNIEAEKVKKYVKWAGIAMVVVLAPTIYTLAINTLEMIWAVGAAALSAGVVWMVTPAVGDWLSAMRYKAVVAVAEANPIETMLSIEGKYRSELSQQLSSITAVDTQYRNVKQQVDGLAKTDPEEATYFGEIASKIKEGLDEMNLEYDDASRALSEYQKQREKAQRLWRVQLSINKALDVSEAARKDVFTDIKKQVAFDTVNTNINKAFARLDSAVQRRKAGNIRLTSPASQVVEGTVVNPQKALPEGMPTVLTTSTQKERTRV